MSYVLCEHLSLLSYSRETLCAEVSFHFVWSDGSVASSLEQQIFLRNWDNEQQEGLSGQTWISRMDLLFPN